MHIIFAAIIAIATPAPRPTYPPVIFHVIPKKANPRKACGIYHLSKAVKFAPDAQIVKCSRPKGLLYF